jgi:hypothetical protein
VSSAVRDATRVDRVVYAVGASSANSTEFPPRLDTPVLWSSTEGLQPLPNLADFVSTQTDALSAYAITPFAEHMASQARTSNAPGTRWVRVTRGSLPGIAANLDLNNGTGAHAFAALALSDSGNVVYGQESQADGTRIVVRYDNGLVSHPDLPAGTTWSVPIPRGTSSKGLVMVGAASVGSITTTISPTPAPPFGYPVLAYNTTAFRYEHDPDTLTDTTAALPKLTDAADAWSFPIAMSSDGAVTVVAGNSDGYPGGEIYLTDAANNHCTPGSTTTGCAGVDALRVPFDAHSVVGAWTGTVTGSVNGEFDGTIVTGVFLGPDQGSRYFVSHEVKRFGVVSPDEVEFGTYTYDLSTRTMTSIAEGAPDEDIDTVTLSPDGPGLRVEDHDPEGTVPVFNLTRIVPPSTVVPVIANTPLSASGRVGQPFNFVIQATHTATFGATGLPDGLAINSSTGVIGGIPTVGGQFAVTITASNSLGASDIETLTLTIEIPTPVGTNVPVEPEVSGAPGPGTSLTFGEITAEGTTTVTVIDDLGQIGVPPPGDGNVAIAGVVYEVTTTAEYQGLITLCFSYAGIDFGTATPQPWHYENNAWLDITSPDGDDADTVPDGVHPDTQTVCGTTTTLSPFVILVSNVVRKGFYSPVNPIAGVLNTVKGGSTVPLKFNVFVDGVNQTTAAGLMPMTVQMVSCDSSAPQDPVDFTVTGETSLRYDAAAGYFIQNWKVPKTPGCYMVRMITTQDALALTARFKVR